MVVVTMQTNKFTGAAVVALSDVLTVPGRGIR